MKALQIKYIGTGSEKQITWATEIFNKEIKKIADFRATAEIRVNDGSMPEKWLSIIDGILADEKIINSITRFANQPAGITIDYKGFVVNGQAKSIAAQIERVAINRYQA